MPTKRRKIVTHDGNDDEPIERAQEDRLEQVRKRLRDRKIEEDLIEKDDFLKKIRRGDAPGYELAVVSTTLPEKPIPLSVVVDLLEDDWPTIRSALKHAHKNELRHARAPTRGWYLTKVIQFGNEHGYLKFGFQKEKLRATKHAML